jgi:hypothetical protein
MDAEWMSEGTFGGCAVISRCGDWVVDGCYALMLTMGRLVWLLSVFVMDFSGLRGCIGYLTSDARGVSDLWIV